MNNQETQKVTNGVKYELWKQYKELLDVAQECSAGLKSDNNEDITNALHSLETFSTNVLNKKEFSEISASALALSQSVNSVLVYDMTRTNLMNVLDELNSKLSLKLAITMLETMLP